MEKKNNVITRFLEEWLDTTWQEALVELVGSALFVIGGYICLVLILMIA